MPTVSANLSTTEYVKLNTSSEPWFNPMILQAHRDSVRIVLSKLKPARNNKVYHLLGGKDAPFPLNSLDTNVWALATSEHSSLIVTETEPYPVKTIQSNGVPIEFSKLTSNATTFNIQKGNLNKLDFFPRIINEQQESSREVQGIVTSTNTVNQVIKISKDNVSALLVTLESAGGVVIDNFESYADSAALQAVWTESGELATLEVTTVHTGDKAMSLPTTNNGDEWERTSSPQDFTDYTGTFNTYFSHTFSQQQLAVYIKDSVGNSKSFTVIQEAADQWCDCRVNEKAMIENPANTLDTAVTDIVTIGYRVVLKRAGGTVKIDNLASVPPPGEIEIKWWDMGGTIPVSGVTSIDDGTQYEKIGGSASSYFLQLDGGKRTYHLEEFSAGIEKSLPDNEIINIDNYYLLELKWVDTDVSVYGADTSFVTNYYENGFACTAPDESTPITAIGEYSDLMFGIMSTQEVYIVKVGWRFNAEPNGDSSILVFLEDTNMEITDIVIDHETSPEQSFDTDLSIRPNYLEDGGKVEFYYNDGYSDPVQNVRSEIAFLYAPPIVNG